MEAPQKRSDKLKFVEVSRARPLQIQRQTEVCRTSRAAIFILSGRRNAA
jgi:hypothetical protein